MILQKKKKCIRQLITRKPRCGYAAVVARKSSSVFYIKYLFIVLVGHRKSFRQVHHLVSLQIFADGSSLLVLVDYADAEISLQIRRKNINAFLRFLSNRTENNAELERKGKGGRTKEREREREDKKQLTLKFFDFRLLLRPSPFAVKWISCDILYYNWKWRSRVTWTNDIYLLCSFPRNFILTAATKLLNLPHLHLVPQWSRVIYRPKHLTPHRDKSYIPLPGVSLSLEPKDIRPNRLLTF